MLFMTASMLRDPALLHACVELDMMPNIPFFGPFVCHLALTINSTL